MPDSVSVAFTDRQHSDALRKRLAAAGDYQRDAEQARLDAAPITHPDDPRLDPAIAQSWRERLRAVERDNGPVKPERRRRQRRPTLASVARQANRAGLAVAAFQVEPGKITVVVEGSKSDNAVEFNEWDEVLEDDAAQPRFRQ
jgi:hypothetical protein